MKIDTTLTEAHIITIPDLGTNTANNQILWGVVVEDASLRFNKGDFCRTSLIQHMSSDIVVTANSCYQVIGPVTKIELPAHFIASIDAGQDPRLCLLHYNGKVRSIIPKAQ